MRYFDAHAHLADARLAGQGLEIARQAGNAGVAGIVVTAARLEEWPEVLRLAQRPGRPGTLGVHPWFAAAAPADLKEQLEVALRAHPDIVAVGEIGLDFWEGREQEARQREVLELQLRAADRLGLPVVLHNRNSWPECLEVIRGLGLTSLRGLAHSFSGDAATLDAVLDLGLSISVGGPLLRPSNQRLRDLVRLVPGDRLLVESDTPDQPAPAYRREGSRPEQVAETVACLAGLLGRSSPELCEQIERNWRSLFLGGAESRREPPMVLDEHR